MSVSDIKTSTGSTDKDGNVIAPDGEEVSE